MTSCFTKTCPPCSHADSSKALYKAVEARMQLFCHIMIPVQSLEKSVETVLVLGWLTHVPAASKVFVDHQNLHFDPPTLNLEPEFFKLAFFMLIRRSVTLVKKVIGKTGLSRNSCSWDSNRIPNFRVVCKYLTTHKTFVVVTVWCLIKWFEECCSRNAKCCYILTYIMFAFSQSYLPNKESNWTGGVCQGRLMIIGVNWKYFAFI